MDPSIPPAFTQLEQRIDQRLSAMEGFLQNFLNELQTQLDGDGSSEMKELLLQLEQQLNTCNGQMSALDSSMQQLNKLLIDSALDLR